MKILELTMFTIPIMLIGDKFIHGQKHILQFYHNT